MDILRFITAGSVDDGKSTLIGRLLYDSKSIMVDHLESLEKQSKNKNEDGLDLALLTDGLRAEREQGITIDVAYKYFTTPKRKFIIADAPGHVQYTRNMVTGASNSDLIIILIDARQGVVEQTRRHTLIASILAIPNLVVAVNKMDLMAYSEDVFNNILIDYHALIKDMNFKTLQFIPISALNGDNIVEKTQKMDWYEGVSLLDYLETLPLQNTTNLDTSRFPVQYVVRPQTPELHDYRGYAGAIRSGIYKVGDKVQVLPSGLESTITKIELGGKEVQEAFAPQSIILHLADDIDISRGDLIIRSEESNPPTLSREIEAVLCWMDDSKPLLKGNKYLLQLNTRTVRAIVQEVEYKIDIQSLEKIQAPEKVVLNDLVKVKLKTAQTLAYDTYANLRENGGAILIDETSNSTVGACMLA